MNCSSSLKDLLFYRHLGVLGSYPQLGVYLALSSHIRRGNLNMRVGTVLVTAPMVPARGTGTNSAFVSRARIQCLSFIFPRMLVTLLAHS